MAPGRRAFHLDRDLVRRVLVFGPVVARLLVEVADDGGRDPLVLGDADLDAVAQIEAEIRADDRVDVRRRPDRVALAGLVLLQSAR